MKHAKVVTVGRVCITFGIGGIKMMLLIQINTDEGIQGRGVWRMRLSSYDCVMASIEVNRCVFPVGGHSPNFI